MILDKDYCLELFSISPHSSKLFLLLFILLVLIDKDSKETIEGILGSEVDNESKGKFSGIDSGRIPERVFTWVLSSTFPLISGEIIQGVSSKKIVVDVKVLLGWVSENFTVNGKLFEEVKEVLHSDVFIWILFLILDTGTCIEVFFVIDVLEEIGHFLARNEK